MEGDLEKKVDQALAAILFGTAALIVSVSLLALQ
jgi:hypothetical protein